MGGVGGPTLTDQRSADDVPIAAVVRDRGRKYAKVDCSAHAVFASLPLLPRASLTTRKHTHTPHSIGEFHPVTKQHCREIKKKVSCSFILKRGVELLLSCRFGGLLSSHGGAVVPMLRSEA
ncbi:unnamed protein product [Ixodes pacificus]